MSTSGPVRTCVGCRQRRPQIELVRVFMDDQGRVLPGRNGPGRGAWLCGDSTGACLAAAADRNGFNRAFRRSPEPSSIDLLRGRWPHPGLGS